MKHVKDMVAEANMMVEHFPAADAVPLVGEDGPKDGIVFIDIRDIRELWRDGKVPGAYHCPRGMLEFWIDPESPYAKDIFQEDKKFVFYCAGGQRSALAARAAQEMGLTGVSHISDGFAGWKGTGAPIEEVKPKK
ncbi:MAG: rhodanese-like domain-containing protein [Pseudomonadota bacterium]